MNTTQNSQTKSSSRFVGLRGLGRGIAVSSAVAVMGMGTMSAADASAAGVSHGIRHAGSATQTASKPGPVDTSTAGTSQLVVRDGKVKRLS